MALFPRLHIRCMKKAPKTALCAKETKNQKPFGFRRFLVEVTGFEPATFWSRTKRATKLRYTSKMEPMKGLEPLTCGLRNRCSTD